MFSDKAATSVDRHVSGNGVRRAMRCVTRSQRRRRRRHLSVLMTAFALVVGCAGGNGADSPASPAGRTPGEVRISGDVYTPMTLSVATLKSYQHHTQPVTVATDGGTRRHVYIGATVESLLFTANPRGVDGRSHPFLTIAVVATGADGYAATLAWTEVLAEDTPSPALIAWAEDGTPLEQPRLVVPGDRNGVRHVKDLTELKVVQLGSPDRSFGGDRHRKRQRGTETG
jgi:DMSO/TMAO reductase YedYZ molybdopterin-dependent catalytic subunit